MRPPLVAPALVALVACASEPVEDAPGAPNPEDATAAARPESPPPSPPMTTFSEPTGDAVGGGLDLGDTNVLVDDDGMLTIDVAIPDAKRTEPAAGDHVLVYVDIDRDYERSGYDVRLVLLGDAARPFAFERYERGKWRDRTPRSYEGSFDHGVHIRVPAADIGVSGGFDFFVASIDQATEKVSDLSPDGALWQRWSYTR